MSLTKTKVALLGAACLAIPAFANAGVIVTGAILNAAQSPGVAPDPSVGNEPAGALEHPSQAGIPNAIVRDTNSHTTFGRTGYALSGGFRTYDLILHVTGSSAGGDGWASCDVSFGLTAGTFYNAHKNGSGADFSANAANTAQYGNFDSQASGSPNGHTEFDTFVNGFDDSGSAAPDDVSPMGAATVLGSFIPASGTANFSDTLTNVSWGASPVGARFAQGTHDIVVARFTVSPNSVGTFKVQVGGTSNGNSPFTFTGNIGGGGTITPEPASGLLLAAGAGLFAARRRRA